MTTTNVRTKIEKVFTFSSYENGTHRTEGWIDHGEHIGSPSFGESLSPLHLMIEAFKYRPLGTKIKVTMEEVD